MPLVARKKLPTQPLILNARRRFPYIAFSPLQMPLSRPNVAATHSAMPLRNPVKAFYIIRSYQVKLLPSESSGLRQKNRFLNPSVCFWFINRVFSILQVPARGCSEHGPQTFIYGGDHLPGAHSLTDCDCLTQLGTKATRVVFFLHNYRQVHQF